MKNWITLLLLIGILSCKRDQPLKPAYKYPELKGYWAVQNDYPFWNLTHTQSTTCVGMAKYYFIDSISPTQYVIYEGDFWGQSYYTGNRVDMQIDTLTDSLYTVYGHNTQYSNPFLNFFKINLKYNRSTKNIEGDIGVNSLVYCTNKPGDSFVGKTLWWKYK